MKRSEAVQLIVDVLNANTQDDKNKLASNILSKLVDVGMLPPLRLVTVRGPADNSWEQERESMYAAAKRPSRRRI